MNSSWLLICFRSSEEDHIWIPSCRSGLHQNSIQQRRDFRTFNKYVWWKDRILALWILHIFFNNFRNFKSSYEKFYIQLQFVSNYDARSLDENTSIHMIALYLLHFNKFSCKISQAKYNIFTVLPLFFYFNSLKQPVILPKTASPVWVRMTTSTASGVRKLEDVPMALIGCDKNGEIKAAKFRYTAGYFCVVILVFVIVF